MNQDSALEPGVCTVKKSSVYEPGYSTLSICCATHFWLSFHPFHPATICLGPGVTIFWWLSLFLDLSPQMLSGCALQQLKHTCTNGLKLTFCIIWEYGYCYSIKTDSDDKILVLDLKCLVQRKSERTPNNIKSKLYRCTARKTQIASIHRYILLISL